MYDAKEFEDKEDINKEVVYSSISERSYYNKMVSQDSIFKLKSSYVPIENILY